MTRLWLAAAALLLQAALVSAAQPELRFGEFVIKNSNNGSQQAAYAPDVALGGQPLAVVAAAQPDDCTELCRTHKHGNTTCAWFNHCASQGGCQGAGQDGGTLGYQQCLLLADANCSLVPPVLLRSEMHGQVVAGFPIRTSQPPSLPNFVVRPVQGLVGGDFDCGSPMLPGKCVFPDPALAAAACSYRDECRSVVVYSNGTDGCGSGLMAVLKTADLVPSNEFISPSVYTLERTEGAPTGGFILAAEAKVVDALPAGSTSASASAASTLPTPNGGNISWLGYLVSSLSAVADGEVVDKLSSVPTVEACARECQRRSPSCNVFNYCPLGSCSYKDQAIEVALTAQQCELRFQQYASPAQGAPPYMLAKGEAAGGLLAGSPLQAWGPELPGFQRHLGNGLFAQPGYVCPDSLKPDVQECLLADPLELVAERCSADPLCKAIIHKPPQLFGLTTSISMLRRAEGANLSRMVATPTALVYSKEDVASGSSSGGGGGGLSAGAIAGIAAACGVVAAAALAAAWVAVRRRKRQQGSGHAVAHASVKDGKALEERPSPKAPAPSAPQNGTSDTARAVAPKDSMYCGTLDMPPANSSSFPLSSQSSHASARPEHVAPLVASVAHVSLARPAVVSPFAAGRRSRVSGSLGDQSSLRSAGASLGGAWSSGTIPQVLTPTASRPPAPAFAAGGLVSCSTPEPSGPQPEPAPTEELHELMAELLQHRAEEEQAAGLGPGSGPNTDMGTAVSGASSGRSSVRTASGTLSLPPSLQAWLIPRSAIEYQRRPRGELAVLGEGAFGRVIRASYNGELVAAKEIEIGRGVEVQEAFLMEAQRMQALRHAHLVTFMGMAVDGNKGILVMELCEGQDLGSALRVRDARGQRLFGWYRHGCRVAYEVASALNYLHSKSVVHMDVKSSNVLLSSTGQAKVSDVGVSRNIERTYLSDLPGLVGTFAWVAPEILMGGHNCTRAVDVFSLSVVLWEIITGERPVRGHMRQPRVPEECPQEAVDLMAVCGSLDPSARPTAKEVMSRLRDMRLAQQQQQQSPPPICNSGTEGGSADGALPQ